MNKDSTFIMIYEGQTDYYNTETGEFIRQYTNSKTSLTIQLDANELAKTRQYVIDNKILDFSDSLGSYRCNNAVIMAPSMERKISLSVNNQFREFNWSDSYCPEEEKRMIDSLDKLSIMLRSMLEKRNQYNSIPESDIFLCDATNKASRQSTMCPFPGQSLKSENHPSKISKLNDRSRPRSFWYI